MALPVVRALLTSAPSNRVLLFYGNDGSAQPDALEELLALKDRHLDRLSLGFVMDREPGEVDLLSGRLDEQRIAAIAAKLFDPQRVREFVVCGPLELEAAVIGALRAAGVAADRIRLEREEHHPAAAPIDQNTKSDGETRVAFVMDGRRRTFAMRTRDDTILEAAERAGIELPYSCKAGVCSTCRTKLVSGKVELAENYALEDWELEQGFILACQAHATTSEIELTYDEK